MALAQHRSAAAPQILTFLLESVQVTTWQWLRLAGMAEQKMAVSLFKAPTGISPITEVA